MSTNRFSLPLLLTIIFCFCIKTHAQFVSLNLSEINRLEHLLSSDPSAKKLYDKIQQQADQSLTEAPRPIDTIRTEGLLKGNPKKTATAAALRDMPKMYALALVYRLSHNKRYLEQATAYLKAWATNNTPNGDPIDDTNLDNAIEAYDLIKTDFSPADNTIISRWLKQTAETEISSPHNRPNRATHFNNWNSHRLKIIGEIAFAINDTTLQQYTITGLKAQVEHNLNPDGSSTDFISRDALHYHVYDLEPLLKLAIVLQRATGINYYPYQSPTTSSIQKSVNWLLPYLTGEKTHPEFVNSTVNFDRQRANNNEPGYKSGTLFDPKNGIHTLLLAAFFDNNLLPIARHLLDTDASCPDWQTALNAIMK
jgi:alginate lyase